MIKRLLVLACGLLALAAPISASADSLVFIRDNNVWLSNIDGTGQYQVTLDGTASSPYSSPSQADDGTIVALRTPPGGRPEIWRMRQDGGLLNAPIDTPAPGTGAIDARVSPDGQLVAYWFVTEVNSGTCLYCIDITTRVLISHSDRFTSPTEVGTPNTGSHPSWMSNNTLLLSNENASQWYYTLGTPEAALWWGDTDNCGCMNPLGLTDGVVSRDGQRVAIVRGDNNELIWLYKTNGAPPAIPTPECELTGPNGKFSNPTWSSDGQTLAWQEGNGVWSAQVPDITNCSTISASQLIVPGATEPDFGPAVVNPGPRPGCANPGNPTPCPTTSPTPTPMPTPGSNTDLTRDLQALIARVARGLRRLAIHGLLKSQLSAAFDAPVSGTLTLTLSTVGRNPTTLSRARVTFTGAGSRIFSLRVLKAELGRLRHAHHMNTTLSATFTQSGRGLATARIGVSLSR